jgi:hypothetical protein
LIPARIPPKHISPSASTSHSPLFPTKPKDEESVFAKDSESEEDVKPSQANDIISEDEVEKGNPKGKLKPG